MDYCNWAYTIDYEFITYFGPIESAYVYIVQNKTVLGLISSLEMKTHYQSKINGLKTHPPLLVQGKWTHYMWSESVVSN